MRYEEYKATEHSWQPSIPNHWNYWRARRLFDNPKEKNSNNEEKNVLSLTLKGVIRNDKDNPIGLAPSDYATYQLFDAGELVFKLIDLENISTSRVGIVPERGIMSSAYIRFKPRNELNIRYFYYQYSDWYQRQVFNGLGAGVRQTLSAQDLLTLKIIVPPREEQDQIVRYLDWKVSCINKLIHGYQRQIKLLEERWRTIESHVCLNGLHKVTLKDSGNKWIGNIPYGWETIKLGQFCSFQNGISESGDFFTDGSPFVNYSDVYRHLELPENVSGTAKSNEKQQKIYSVQEGDIFFTRTSENIEEAGMAAVCLHTIANAVFSGFLIRCRPTKNIVDTNFIKYYLQIPAVRNHFSSTMNIVTRASVGQYLLRQLAVVVPPMEEQHEIADYLDDESRKYERIKRNIQHEVDLLKEYRTRLISDVVTGQMDVRGIVIPDYTPEDDTEDNEADEETTDEEVSMDAD